MSTVLNLQIRSTDSEATEAIGAKIGARLKGSEVIVLASDLGGGKTTFTRGLVRGAGSEDHVSSPTFTVSKVYSSPLATIHHFDFYRLEDAGLMAHELQDVLEDANCAVVVEWGSVVNSVLPSDRVDIAITPLSETERNIDISYSENFSYLLEGLTK